MVLALCAAVFLIGGALRWTALAAIVAGLAAFAMQARSHRGLTTWSPLLALLGTAAAFTALQLVPFPSVVLRVLDPTGYQLVVDGATLAGRDAPSFLPLSLDPPGTLLELGKLIGYLAVAYVCLRLATEERGRLQLLSIVALVIGVAGLVGLAHQLLGAHELYGLYAPRAATPRILGPLLNGNHYAGLLAIGSLTSAGLATYAKQTLPRRVLWGAIATLCLVECLLIESRGAAIGLAVGMSVFAGLLLAQRWTDAAGKRPDYLKVTLPATVVALCSVVIVYFTVGGVTHQIAKTDAEEFVAPRSKFSAWRSAEELVAETPWIGVGRGAFEPAFTRIHPASGFATYTHLENEYLQAVVDWGAIGALAIGLGVVLTAQASIRRWRGGSLAAAGLGAMIAIGAQSFVDFGIELPGVAVPVIVILATLTYVPLAESNAHRHRRNLRLRAVALVTGLVVVAAVASPWGRTLHEDQNALHDDGAPTVDRGLAAMARHPLDYFAAAYTAGALYQTGDPRATSYLNRALLLHPWSSDIHRLAARLLRSAGRPLQALVEYSLALQVSINPVPLVKEVVGAYKGDVDVGAAIPATYPLPRRIVQVLLDLGRPKAALLYLKRSIEANPDDDVRLGLLVNVALDLGDLATAETTAAQRFQRDGSLETGLALARILVKAQKLPAALKIAEQALKAHGATTDLAAANLLIVDVLIAQEDWAGAKTQLRAMRELPEVYALERKHIHRRLALVERSLGNARQAELEALQARDDPQDR